jgi:Transglycosylase SLT domain
MSLTQRSDERGPSSVWRSYPRHLTCALTLCVSLFPPLASAVSDPSQICVEAAAEASRISGVPFDVLLAVTLTETGRDSDGTLRPWPWAMNLGGESLWLADAMENLAAAEAALAEGRTNVDLGCFQINYHWHSENFGSLEDMIDPVTNATYAADFLARLYDSTGSWPDAVADYHSRTPEHADRYRARFAAIYEGLTTGGMPPDAPPRPNSFPLLQAGAPGSAGSLVPLATAGRPLIGGS